DSEEPKGRRQDEPGHAQLLAGSASDVPRSARTAATRSRTAGTTASAKSRTWASSSVIGQNTKVSNPRSTAQDARVSTHSSTEPKSPCPPRGYPIAPITL